MNNSYGDYPPKGYTLDLYDPNGNFWNPPDPASSHMYNAMTMYGFRPPEANTQKDAFIQNFMPKAQSYVDPYTDSNMDNAYDVAESKVTEPVYWSRNPWLPQVNITEESPFANDYHAAHAQQRNAFAKRVAERPDYEGIRKFETVAALTPLAMMIGPYALKLAAAAATPSTYTTAMGLPASVGTAANAAAIGYGTYEAGKALTDSDNYKEGGRYNTGNWAGNAFNAGMDVMQAGFGPMDMMGLGIGTLVGGKFLDSFLTARRFNKLPDVAEAVQIRYRDAPKKLRKILREERSPTATYFPPSKNHPYKEYEYMYKNEYGRNSRRWWVDEDSKINDDALGQWMIGVGETAKNIVKRPKQTIKEVATSVGDNIRSSSAKAAASRRARTHERNEKRRAKQEAKQEAKRKKQEEAEQARATAENTEQTPHVDNPADEVTTTTKPADTLDTPETTKPQESTSNQPEHSEPPRDNSSTPETNSTSNKQGNDAPERPAPEEPKTSSNDKAESNSNSQNSEPAKPETSQASGNEGNGGTNNRRRKRKKKPNQNQNQNQKKTDSSTNTETQKDTQQAKPENTKDAQSETQGKNTEASQSGGTQSQSEPKSEGQGESPKPKSNEKSQREKKAEAKKAGKEEGKKQKEAARESETNARSNDEKDLIALFEKRDNAEVEYTRAKAQKNAYRSDENKSDYAKAKGAYKAAKKEVKLKKKEIDKKKPFFKRKSTRKGAIKVAAGGTALYLGGKNMVESTTSHRAAPSREDQYSDTTRRNTSPAKTPEPKQPEPSVPDDIRVQNPAEDNRNTGSSTPKPTKKNKRSKVKYVPKFDTIGPHKR